MDDIAFYAALTWLIFAIPLIGYCINLRIVEDDKRKWQE